MSEDHIHLREWLDFGLIGCGASRKKRRLAGLRPAPGAAQRRGTDARRKAGGEWATIRSASDE